MHWFALVLIAACALAGLGAPGFSTRTVRGLLLVQAALIVLACAAFVRQLFQPDTYFDDGRTYWEYGGSDPNHIGAAVLIGVSLVAVVALMGTRRRIRDGAHAAAGSVLLASAVVAIVGAVASMAAFGGH